MLHIFLSLAVFLSDAIADETCNTVQKLEQGYYLKTSKSGTELRKKAAGKDVKVADLDKTQCGLFKEFRAIDINGDKQFDIVMTYEDESFGGMTIWVNNKGSFKRVFAYESADVPTLLEFNSATYLLHDADDKQDLEAPNLISACKSTQEFNQALLAGSTQWSGRFKAINTAYDSNELNEAQKWIYRLRFYRSAPKVFKLNSEQKFVEDKIDGNGFLKWRRGMIEKYFGQSKGASCRNVVASLLK